MDIKEVTERVERCIQALVQRHAQEKFWVTHFGSNEIHPRHLVYWICVESDAEKRRLSSDPDLMGRLRQILVTEGYPPEGREGVFIGCESKETVDRESSGNWWHHWK